MNADPRGLLRQAVVAVVEETVQLLLDHVLKGGVVLRNGCPQVVPGQHRHGTLAHHYVDPLGYECIGGDPPDAVAAPVRAGGAVVFSSLTPHLTGPNLTTDVRKAWILQYAPDGARVQKGDPAAGPPTGSHPCTDPDRQFPVLRNGKPA